MLQCYALHIRNIDFEEHSDAGLAAIGGVVKRDFTEAIVRLEWHSRVPRIPVMMAPLPAIVERFLFQIDAARLGFPDRRERAIRTIGAACYYKRACRFIRLN